MSRTRPSAIRCFQRERFSRHPSLFFIGVMYHGTPKLDAKATAVNPALQAALDRDLDAELDDMRNDLRSFTFYPVVSLGLAFRF